MIATTLRSFATKLRAITPRERAALAVLAAVAALTALVYAMDWATTSDRAAQAATDAATDVETLQTTFQDETYRRRISVGTGDVWRWSRTRDAFASQEITTELESLCLQAGFSDPQVTVVEQEPQRGRVSTIEASVTTDFNWASFLALLEAFEAADLSLAVRSIDVSEDEGAQTLTFVVAVPLIDGGEAR